MKKYMRVFALLAILILLVTAMRLPAGADFGDISGDSDWGDSDWDWGDSDSDWDWGDSSSGSGGSLGSVAIVVVIIVVILLIPSKKGGAPTRKAVPMAVPVASHDLRPISEYSTIDPNFSEAELVSKMTNLYVQLQHGWTAKDISSLRPYFTDATYDQYERQLESHRQRHITNYVEGATVLRANILGFYQANNLDHIVVRLEARIVDYTLNDDTGALVKGNRTAEKFLTYEWHLIRRTGVTTQEKDEMERLTCPNCGAPLDINASAKCPYCDSVITRRDHDFAIFNIRGVSQRTVGK